MNNFDWTKFTKKIAVKADMKTIYDAWTVPAELEKWFLSTALYFDEQNNQADATANIQGGQSYKWTWFLYDGEENGKVVKTNGTDALDFTFAGDTLVQVRLSEQNGWVIVELTQKDIPTDDDSKRNVRLGCESGWSFFMVNLKSLYEGGNDLRNKDPELKGLLNT